MKGTLYKTPNEVWVIKHIAKSKDTPALEVIAFTPIHPELIETYAHTLQESDCGKYVEFEIDHDHFARITKL